MVVSLKIVISIVGAQVDVVYCNDQTLNFVCTLIILYCLILYAQ